MRNRPVMRLRRPAMSVTRESMVRILVMEKFLACTPGARANPRHWKAQCQAKEGTPLLHMPLFRLICGTDDTKPAVRSTTRSKQENHARQKKNLFHGRDRRSVTFGPLEWQGAVAATSAAARSERKARKALLRAPNVQTTVSACLKKRFVLATSIESQIDYVVVSRQLHS